ncbi:poly-beta-hydroxybutyrate synthase [Legionella geestiana]|uniref:Poly-beta-hydroxybutyrate synthase n=1 Tax=Legionella geestiana TaxID=45065 RepID=A0A0W0U044_9GAMM|nr:class I poly(R)-hydroxyalkanoic acid synthase [Legionella geestiana]KTD00971.1 poly-beta-hydroxybutyrate synthase [Legionella geestiana]QBS12000.1 class I poly(R)-hydroxyalkanoic acid synthase [Legionella geestiana]STX53283.1 poly-beta-hydroxybutyrate synthase [Legionella geestiana]
MTQHDELATLLHQIAEESLRLLAHFQKNPAMLAESLDPWMTFGNNLQTLSGMLAMNPADILSRQAAFWSDATTLWQKQCELWMQGQSLPLDDPRFSSEEWQENPFFSVLAQFYLLASEHAVRLVEKLPIQDVKMAHKLRFFVRQYLDALSPANFPATNPKLFAETVHSRGLNLLRGLQNFLEDIDRDSASLVMRMTDMRAFTVGKNIAATEGEVIYRNELMEIIQYTAKTPRTRTIPLLIVPPWINKYYVLDLSAHNSFIGWLVSKGITVFTISWVNPGSELANTAMCDYLQNGSLRAIEVVREQMGCETVNTLGFCIGGTLLAMTLAWLAAGDTAPVASATFLATLIDFSEPGDIGVYIDDALLEKLEADMQSKGFLDGRLMAQAFNSLRANDLVWSFFIKNYLQGRAQVPFDILYWNADSTNMPAKMHSQYLRWMYLHNDLVKPGKIRCNGRALNIGAITIPAFFVATEKDHIAPWRSVWKGFQKIGGDKQFLLGGSGHIAGIINPPASNKYHYCVNPNIPKAADKWLDAAERFEGSWWPEWLKWLKAHSGSSKKAPVFDALPLKSLGSAPGTCVLKKSGLS